MDQPMDQPRDQPAADEAAVLAANSAFYRAFERLDLDAMADVWLRDDYVECIHPGWDRLVGREPTLASWAGIFRNTATMRFTLTEVRVIVRGDLGWVSLEENLTSQVGGQWGVAKVLAINVFERRGDRWWMVVHHASPATRSVNLGRTTIN